MELHQISPLFPALNECELNFHDCDPRADCHDMEDGYQCVCPDGWQGKGVVTDPSQARANGRVCIGQSKYFFLLRVNLSPKQV